VLTLFSASNYCGRNRNKGAVAIFTHGQLAAEAHPEPELVQFEATQASADVVDLRNLLFLQTLIAERLPRAR